MNKIKLKSYFFAILFAPAVISGANAFELKGGKWGVTTTTISPMSPEPQVEYLEECFKGTFDPMLEMLDKQLQSCAITTNEDSSNKLDATMQCAVPGAGTMNGKILFQANGDSANGVIDLSMDMGLMTMNMGSNWTAEYLGECSQE